jgi:class 3 adenylate cyclase
MLRYIPQFILRQAASGASQGSLDAFALLFDIADFTRIGTSLQALGKQGAEDLSAMLDDLFAEPIQFIESYGGFVSLFAGDAFCAIFPNAESTAVASAVNAIRGWLAAHNSYPTSAGTFELKVRLTVTRGELRWRIFANPFQHEYAFFGEPMRELAALSELKLDHIFSEQAANAIGLDRFHRVEGGWSLADIDFSPPPAPGDIPPAVAARERFQNPRFAASTPQPEIRSAAFCFARLEGIAPSARETAIADLEQLADACHGLVNKLDATDKGLLAIILFGLPLTEGRTLHQICKFSLAALARQPLLALGISCGEVIAGYTGAGQAREYTAMGHPVNLAARLMGKARPGEILTDAGFWQEFHQSYSFTYLGLLNLKGIDQPLRYYSLSHQTPATVARQENAFTGREAELASLRQMLATAPDSGSNPVIYVCGEPGIGKSRLVREALAIRRKLLGDEHPDTAALMNHLARCYQQQEKFGQAEPLLRQALAVTSRSLGPEHPGTADIIESLASLNNSLGRLDEASELYRQAIAIHSASEGPEHPHTAIAIYNLSDTCFNGGRLREAEPLCRKALEIWSKTLGSDHPWTIEALKTLVAIYTKLPEPDKAAHYQALLPPEPEA